MSIDYSKFAFPKPPKKEKKKTKPLKRSAIKGKKHNRTKKTEIKTSIKKTVWIRDGCKCIFCGIKVPWNYANAHLKKRSEGGLGIPENLFTACQNCHNEEDNGLNAKEYEEKAKTYLKAIYGVNWKEENLIYKKYK